MTLAELAERLGCRLDGDGTLEVGGVAALDDAGPGDVTFLAQLQVRGAAADHRASAVIADDSTTSAPCAVLRTSQPYLALAEARVAPRAGVTARSRHQPARVDRPDGRRSAPTSMWGRSWSIGPGVRVGARVIIDPHVVIGADVSIGDDCHPARHVSIREAA